MAERLLRLFIPFSFLSILFVIVTNTYAIAPVAVDDAFTLNANTRLSRTAADGVLVNDTDFDPQFHRIETYDKQTAFGGSVVLNPDGSFDYDARPGFTGTDTFTYTVRSDEGAKSATVTLTVTGPVVWFLDDSAAAGGNGTYQRPFNSFTPLSGTSDPDKPGDRMFVFSGTYPLASTFALENNQHLIGHSEGLSLPETGLTIAPDTAPVLTTNGIVLALSNTIRGVNINSSASAALSGTNFGTLTTSGVAINSANRALSLTTGTCACSFSLLESTASVAQGIQFSSVSGTVTSATTNVSGSTSEAIRVDSSNANISLGGGNVTGGTGGSTFYILNSTNNISYDGAITGGTGGAFHSAVRIENGSPTVNIGGTVTSTANQFAVSVVNTTGGTANFTGNVTNATVNSGGIVINLADSPINFNTINLGTSTSRLTQRAIDISDDASHTRTYNFGTVNIYTEAAGGLYASNHNGNLNINGGVIDAVEESAINIDGPVGLTNLNVTLDTVSSIDGIRNIWLLDVSGSLTSTTTTVLGSITFARSTASINLGTGTLTGGTGSFNAIEIINSSGSITYNGDITGGTNSDLLDIAAVEIRGASPTVTFGGTITGANTEPLIVVSNTAGGAVTFNGTVTNGSSGNEGVRIFNANGNVTFTNLNLGIATNRMTDLAVTISGGSSAATYDLGTVSIFTTGMRGISALNVDGTINITNGIVDTINADAIGIEGPVGLTTLDMTLTTISSTGGLNNVLLQNVSGALTATTTNVSGSFGQAILINNSSATINLGSGAVTGGTAGDAFDVLSSSGSVTYNGTITGGTDGTATALSAVTVASGNPTVNLGGTVTGANTENTVVISSTTGGAVNFTDNVTNGGTANRGIQLTSVGGNVSFNTINLGTSVSRITQQAVTITNGSSAATYNLGTVNIFTTGQVGISATGFDGNLNITAGTVDATGATAISIDGPAGLTTLNMPLTNVSASGGTNGISIIDTDGTFTVSGSGTTAGSGGTIQSTTGTAVNLSNASNISLNYMTIQNNGGDGIAINNLNNLTLNQSTLFNNGDAANESGIDASNLTGTFTAQNVTVDNSFHSNISIINTSGSLTFNLSNSTISDTESTANGDGIFVDSQGTALTVNVSNNTFSSNLGDHFHSYVRGNVTANISLTNNTLTGGNPLALGQNITVNGVSGYAGTMTYNITGNTISGSVATAVTVDSSLLAASGVLQGTISNNTIGTSGVDYSCSRQGSGLDVEAHGSGTHTALISNNTIYRCFDRGIQTIANDGSGTFNLTVLNNTVAELSGGAIAVGRQGFYLNVGSFDADSHTVCLVLGDLSTPLKNKLSFGDEGPGYTDINVRHRFNTTIRLPGYSGGQYDTNAVGTFLAARNDKTTGGAATTSITTLSQGNGFTNGAVCPLP